LRLLAGGASYLGRSTLCASSAAWFISDVRPATILTARAKRSSSSRPLLCSRSWFSWRSATCARSRADSSRSKASSCALCCAALAACEFPAIAKRTRRGSPGERGTKPEKSNVQMKWQGDATGTEPHWLRRALSSAIPSPGSSA